MIKLSQQRCSFTFDFSLHSEWSEQANRQHEQGDEADAKIDEKGIYEKRGVCHESFFSRSRRRFACIEQSISGKKRAVAKEEKEGRAKRKLTRLACPLRNAKRRRFWSNHSHNNFFHFWLRAVLDLARRLPRTTAARRTYCHWETSCHFHTYLVSKVLFPSLRRAGLGNLSTKNRLTDRFYIPEL